VRRRRNVPTSDLVLAGVVVVGVLGAGYYLTQVAGTQSGGVLNPNSPGSQSQQISGAVSSTALTVGGVLGGLGVLYWLLFL